MKNLATLLLILLSTVVFGQTSGNLLALSDGEKDVFEKFQIRYVIGDSGDENYPLETKTLETFSVKNGDRFPILKYYESIKKEFIGGELINETLNTTSIIKDIVFSITDDKVDGVFHISGDKFDFILVTSECRIVKEHGKFISFAYYSSDKKEVFTIKKK